MREPIPFPFRPTCERVILMKKAAFALLLAFLLPFAACGKAETVSASSEKEPLSEDSPVLPEEMPEDFAIRFLDWIDPEQANVLDTFDGRIQKDLVEDGMAETSFTPSDALRTELYRLVRESGIVSIRRAMTSHVLATGDERVDCEPLWCFRVIFRADGKTYRIDGDITAEHYRGTDPDADRFLAFCSQVSELLRDLPEFRALPEPRGAYE